MKSILFVLLLCLIGLGLYRGWFALSSHRDDESNKVNVNLTMDPDRAKEDVEKARDATLELGDRARDTVQSEGK